MKAEDARYMWLMIFFDLPVKSKPERKQATQFRNALLKDGFMMLQYSVYARACLGEERVQKHLTRVRRALPENGSVRSLRITDKQYASMEMMLGLKKKAEKITPNQMVLL